jgi:hypothetical protein
VEDWLAGHWVDVLGWGGSGLLVASLLQVRVLRFRTLNTVASVVLAFFNLVIGVWPQVAMNAALAGINVWFIAKLLGERHDDAAFEVVAVGPRDDFLRHVLRLHHDEIVAFQPDFRWEPESETDSAFIILKGDETVGVVVLGREGDVARIRLDYVTPKYRDCTPGEFLWRRSGLLSSLGIRRVVTSPKMVGAYYDQIGFRNNGHEYVLDV